MSYTLPAWANEPSTASPLNAANHVLTNTAINDLDRRVANQVYNVKDYGAVGNGSTNDTTAIQNAINAAGTSGGVVYFPPGSYQISTLSIPAGIVLRGANGGGGGDLLNESLISTLGRIASTNQHMLVGAQGAWHVRIEYLHLDGNRNNNTSGDGIHLNDVTPSEEAQWRIHNCFIEANPGYGVYVGAGRRACHVTDSDVQYNNLSGIRLSGSDGNVSRCIVGTNKVHGVYVSASVSRITDCDIFINGTAANSGTGSGIYISSGVILALIKGCGIDRNLYHGILLDTGVDGCSIIGNTLHSNSQDVNQAASHINVLTTTGTVTLAGNVFGYDGLTNNVDYSIFLASGATVYEFGSVSQTSASALGLTNRPYGLIIRAAGAFPPPAGYQFTGSPHNTGTSATHGTNTLRLVPWLVPTTTTITRLGAEVTVVGDSGSKVRLGIYADNGSTYPGALVVDAGQINGDSATVQEKTISTTLKPGLYWVGGVVQSVTTTQPTLRINASWAPPVPISSSTIWTAADTAVGYSQSSVSGALPSTFSAGAGVIASCVRTFVKV